MQRGFEGRELFKDDKDREEFIKRLAEGLVRKGVELDKLTKVKIDYRLRAWQTDRF